MDEGGGAFYGPKIDIKVLTNRHASHVKQPTRLSKVALPGLQSPRLVR